MTSPIYPIQIQAKIAFAIADVLEILEEEFRPRTFKKNSWTKMSECPFNCGNLPENSSVHSGSGGFITKCCNKKGKNLLDYFIEKDGISLELAIQKIGKLMGVSVDRMPEKLNGFSLEYSQEFRDENGELFLILGHYDCGFQLEIEPGNTSVSAEKKLAAINNVLELTDITSIDIFTSQFESISSYYLHELISNSDSNGLADAGGVIKVDGHCFIDVVKFDRWFSMSAKRES